MAKRVLLGLVGGVLGYLVGAVGGGILLSLLSSNTHDRSVEAAMTGAFVFGPIGAVAGCIAAIRSKRRAPSAGGAV
jgi:hypothetical protein